MNEAYCVIKAGLDTCKLLQKSIIWRNQLVFLLGTFAPDFRASDKPIAIACLGFVTFWPDPLFSLPALNAFISRSTLCDAFGPYWVDFFALDFFAVVFFPVDFAGFFAGILFSLQQ